MGVKRISVALDAETALTLERLAESLHTTESALARWLLATALDGADPGPQKMTELLDRIPGAFERAQLGRAQARAGQAMPLEEL